MERRPYRVAAAYDTETSNVCTDAGANEWHAYPVLYIANDLRGCDLRTYKPGDGTIRFHRHADEMLDDLDGLMQWGEDSGCIPVVCAYNLMFDLQPIIYELNERYAMAVSAQSSTHAYTVDVLDAEGNTTLRFWDTFYLEMRGLSAMGETCGLPKAEGEWDYSLIRTPETPLTDEELHYAARDTEVIPAYLRYLLESNGWLKPDMLGNRVLTKTSLVRMAGKMETGRLKVKRRGRAPISVQKMFTEMCAAEIAPDYASYAMRKGCFRGGLTFTAANHAGEVMGNVYSLDEVSAHHAYINGHMVPVRFQRVDAGTLQRYAERIVSTPLDIVLEHYENPFCCAMHARVEFTNMRLRKGSAFERLGIATLAEGKFKSVSQRGEWGGDADAAADTSTRAAGYHDAAWGAVFAFGKLYAADRCIVHLSEIELYICSMVYEWDAMRAIDGEASCNFVKPPDYVTLLSNTLFERKQSLKAVLKVYKEGVPYTGELHSSIPDGIAARLRDGSMSTVDLQGYYQSTVKGMFNSIYGTQAQDVFKPDFKIENGEIRVSEGITPEAYADKLDDKKKSLVLYTYGLRIVGGSRLALAIAIELVSDALGDGAIVIGGDTDSLKISCRPDIGADALMAALDPLHRAVRASIDICMQRVRRLYPDHASGLDGVGTFEVEGDPYPLHMEAWNKARVSWDGERSHITCAGLSRPKGAYTIEDWMDDRMSEGEPFERIAPMVLGWGVRVANDVSHAIEHARPAAADVLDMDITDYMGVTSHVRCHESIALYSADRVLGDTTKGTNARTVDYLRHLGRDVDTSERELSRDGYSRLTEYGWDRVI